MTTRFIIPALLVTFALGCEGQQAEAERQGETVSHAVVSQAQADRAFVIAQGIDYLPWGYTEDGCYARALYMSMELAVERIPSSSQYINATNGGALRPVDGPVWGWHVAPMVKVTAEGTPMIIDPSLFDRPEVARSLTRWVERNNPTPAADFALALAQGSQYRDPRVADAPPIASFAELNAFAAGDIESACTVAWDYLERELPAPTGDALATKRARLVERTKTLITGLRAVEKLEGLTADTLSCDGHARAAEAPTVAPTTTTTAESAPPTTSAEAGAPAAEEPPADDKDEAAE